MNLTQALRGFFSRIPGAGDDEEGSSMLQKASQGERPVLRAVFANAIVDQSGTVVAEAKDGVLMKPDGSIIGTGGGSYPDEVAPINFTAPGLSGTAEVGALITCSTGVWTVGGGVSYAFQWQLDAVNVGTNSQTYTPEAAGDLQCLVTASNSDGEATEPSNTLAIEAPADARLTEDGGVRLTEDGNTRLIE